MILSIYTHHTAKEVFILLLFNDVFLYNYYAESQILTRSIFVSSFLSEDNWNSCLFHHVRFYYLTRNRRAVSVEFQETGDLGHKNIMGRKKERWYGCIATWVGCGHFRWVSHSPAIVKSLRELCCSNLIAYSKPSMIWNLAAISWCVYCWLNTSTTMNTETDQIYL